MPDLKRLACLVVAIAAGSSPAMAADPYPRAGHRAVLTEPGQHQAEASATIIDERTIQIDHFTYDGTAPLVYFYLGATDSQADFTNGIPIGPVLDRPYADESLTVQLPVGQTLDGYTAISVWCELFSVNFSSATFAPPYARNDLQTDLSVPGIHDVEGTAIILDDRTIHIEHFTYDGTAPLVYFYLGVTNSQTDLTNGISIGPLLDRAYLDESITVQLPEGQSLNGYGALSVWCVQFSVDFGSGLFPRSPADLDIDGDVDADDFDQFDACATGPAVPQTDPACSGTDLDSDGDTDQSDFGLFQRCYSGPDVLASTDCAS